MSAAVLLALMGCLGLPPVPTSVKLFDGQNKLVGFVDLLEIKGGVQIRVHTLGMAPGIHGLNIHQNAVCEPPSFASAGPILTARDAKDSVLAGDLPDITAGTTEWSDTTISWPLIRLDKGGRGVFHNGGSSFVVTQEPDNGHASPEGSGTRIACGVVKERPEIR
ncbi:MAG: superoxide dismutase family protein [Gemmatimonadota bacterium]